MNPGDVVDAEWRELPQSGGMPPDGRDAFDVAPAIRARARLAQAVALRHMEHGRHGFGRVVTAPAPQLRLFSSRDEPDPIWLASCGDTQGERARAAETLAINDFLSRRPRQHPRSM
jgi:hypothetical protein